MTIRVRTVDAFSLVLVSILVIFLEVSYYYYLKVAQIVITNNLFQTLIVI